MDTIGTLGKAPPLRTRLPGSKARSEDAQSAQLSAMDSVPEPKQGHRVPGGWNSSHFSRLHTVYPAIRKNPMASAVLIQTVNHPHDTRWPVIFSNTGEALKSGIFL